MSFLGAFVVFVLGSGITTLVYGILLLLRYLAIQYNYGIFNLFLTSIVLVVVGGLLILTVFLGVYGVWKDLSSVRLVTLVLVLIIVVAMGKNRWRREEQIWFMFL
jgi:lysylphosphatidylglycerol synthetase-like protein (DUF2156 family)